MLAQSHIPGSILLLPALPRSLAAGGLVRSVHLRSDVKVSFEWAEGRVSVGMMVFGSWHPWLRGMSESEPGFFTAAAVSDDSAVLSVVAPNKLRFFSCPNDRCTAKAVDSTDSSKCLHSVVEAPNLGPYDGKNMNKINFTLDKKCLPLTAFFCDAQLKANECVQRMEDLFTHHRR